MRFPALRAMACVMLLAQLVLCMSRGQVLLVSGHGDHDHGDGRHGHSILHHHDADAGHRGAHEHGDMPMHVHLPDHDARLVAPCQMLSPIQLGVVATALLDEPWRPSLRWKEGCRRRGLSDDPGGGYAPLDALTVIRLLV
jgi:hypothetical protein